jgi:predicted HTH transcriptional regulator
LQSKTEKNELSKDVSALANSPGGFLVYGMIENNHVPTTIDVGVDRNVITKEWVESVIKARIQPIIDEFRIKQIDLTGKGPDRVCYVLDIPQATWRAPHQA